MGNLFVLTFVNFRLINGIKRTTAKETKSLNSELLVGGLVGGEPICTYVCELSPNATMGHDEELERVRGLRWFYLRFSDILLDMQN
ncbi:unnamed protein product [Ilex paraguariensis]|uniref:Uncharacterized protein n=1 Tax=Ilex paraguariensis TaxID=185542 RepID=A0ABC8UTV0_9AQUA